ncbi:hypothetical protein ACYZTM_14560 [Pseudomonas sp. MDT2-39-1]
MNCQLRITLALVISALGLFSSSAIAGGADVSSCPSKDFSAFLAAYLESSSVQREFTHTPLKKLITVDAEPEPEQKIVFLEKENLKFPIVPGKEKRTADGLEVKVLEASNGIAKIKIEKPDTDYQVFYTFKLELCWFLDEVQDYSL